MGSRRYAPTGGELGEQEAAVLTRLLQGQAPAEIEAAMGLDPGTVDTMRGKGAFQAALTRRRAGAELARKDRLAALAGRALGALEKALDAEDLDPKLALAVLQLAEKLPPAVYPGDGQGTLEDMEHNAARDRIII